jgi:hypothetical protein
MSVSEKVNLFGGACIGFLITFLTLVIPLCHQVSKLEKVILDPKLRDAYIRKTQAESELGD